MVVPSYEISSPWHWPKAERAPENLVPGFLLMSGTDISHQQTHCGEHHHRNLSVHLLPLPWLSQSPFFCVTTKYLNTVCPENTTSGFNSLPKPRVSNLYFPRERCSTMLNSNLAGGKTRYFLFLLSKQSYCTNRNTSVLRPKSEREAHDSPPRLPQQQ